MVIGGIENHSFRPHFLVFRGREHQQQSGSWAVPEP